ncbi:WXG100 family type VII secretion target [Aldersonia sp. NBC_00410]|jgi:WXG100 family type VII secretion target|uniref:WXG100 family type VII secretion target n=1 Tax=Aldersonia sp. NBC_00410 TaxID=2975954 RepID=UPI0022541657|nr:WXG100 family type VII secretion target [Aldersonia sp. NBC_00410]MCX5045076.1 WXG100 family type VII secretion target [Aldersonia sp. NBC_00410]
MTSGDARPHVHVVPEEVQALGQFAADVAEQLKSGSGALDRDVAQLLDTWKGTAADGYRSGWDEVHKGALGVWDALTDLAEKLGVSAAGYQATDDANAATVRSVAVD